MKRILIAAGLVLALSTSAFALNKGQSELNAYASIGSTKTKPEGGSTSKNTDVNTRFGYGYFLTDGLSLGADIDYSYSKSGEAGAEATNSMYFLGTAKYHFMPKSVVTPYVGVQLGGYTSETGSTSSTDGYAYGVLGGVKFFMTENASLNAELNMLSMSVSTTVGTSSYDADMTNIKGLVGLSYYFGK